MEQGLEQIKVVLALPGTGEALGTYARHLPLLLAQHQVELPVTSEDTILNTATAERLRRATSSLLRSIPVAKRWTFFMTPERYAELCRDNPSSHDPIPHVHGCIPHVLHGPDVVEMTGYPEALAVALKLRSHRTYPPTLVCPR